MIFKMLVARDMKRLYGTYISESDMDKILDSMTEWQALKQLLPFKSKAITAPEARNELLHSIEDALRKPGSE